MTERGNGVTGHPDGGWQHRAMVMFIDLVGSTELSGRYDPEQYGLLVRRYITEVRSSVEGRFGGDVVSEVGDGILVVFGAMHAHADDAERAIRAGLEVVEQVRLLSAETERETGETLGVRVGIHRGPIYRSADDSVYGLTVNVAARLQTLAPPNSVVVSDEVQRMVGHLFETDPAEPQLLKGVDEPIQTHRVISERIDRPVLREPRTGTIDRELEWERLNAAWTATRSGQMTATSTVLLRGEAGVGKSHLASRIAGLALDDGAPVVELAGSAIEDAGLYPVRRLIERSTGIHRSADGTERLERLRADLAERGLGPDTYVPRLAPILGLDPTVGYVAEAVDARKLNEEVLTAACAYVGSFLGDGPSMLVFEDVQWYDESTRELMVRLGQRQEFSLAILTARPNFEPADSRVEVIDLRPFSDSDAGRFIDALCEVEAVSPETRQNMIERSDGIPLYIEELVVNVRRGLASLLDDRSGRSTDGVPDLLYDLLVERLASAAGVIPVATASAVIGRDVDRRLLQTLLGLSSTELDAALDELCDKGLLERSPDGRPHRFRHELLREVAYELQPPSRRRSVHRAVAEALVARDGAGEIVDWSIVASHFERAEEWLQASGAYEHAARTARGIGAFTEARRHLTRAIDFLGSSAEGPERGAREIKLRLQRGYLTVSAEGGSSAAAIADYDRCLELAALDPLGDEMFETVVVIWSYHFNRGEMSRAREISEFTYSNLGKREWYRNINMAAFGIIDCFEGHFESALDRLEFFAANRDPGSEQRFIASWFNPSEPVSAILHTLAIVRFMTGDLPGAEAAFREALERAQATAFPQGPFSVAYALSMEVWMQFERGRLDDAGARLADIMAIATRHGFDEWALVGATEQTTLDGLRALAGTATRDELIRHAQALEAVADVWRQLNTQFFLPYYIMRVGVLYTAAGDERNAHAQFEESLRLADQTGMDFWRPDTLRHLALLDPDRSGTERGLREALEVARRQHASLYELRIALDIAGLGGDQDLTLVREAIDRFGRNTSYPEVVRAEALLSTTT